MAKETNEETKKVWKAFDKYWDATEWESVSRKKVRKILGDTLDFDIPKGITDPKIGTKFYEKVKEAIKPKRTGGFGGVTVSFEDVDATGEDIFGSEPLTYPEVNKALHNFIKENGLKIVPKKKKTTEDEDDEDETPKKSTKKKSSKKPKVEEEEEEEEEEEDDE